MFFSHSAASIAKKILTNKLLLKDKNILSIGVIADPKKRGSHAISIGVLSIAVFNKNYSFSFLSTLSNKIPIYTKETTMPKAQANTPTSSAATQKEEYKMKKALVKFEIPNPSRTDGNWKKELLFNLEFDETTTIKELREEAFKQISENFELQSHHPTSESLGPIVNGNDAQYGYNDSLTISAALTQHEEEDEHCGGLMGILKMSTEMFGKKNDGYLLLACQPTKPEAANTASSASTQDQIQSTTESKYNTSIHIHLEQPEGRPYLISPLAMQVDKNTTILDLKKLIVLREQKDPTHPKDQPNIYPDTASVGEIVNNYNNQVHSDDEKLLDVIRYNNTNFPIKADNLISLVKQKFKEETYQYYIELRNRLPILASRCTASNSSDTQPEAKRAKTEAHEGSLASTIGTTFNTSPSGDSSTKPPSQTNLKLIK